VSDENLRDLARAARAGDVRAAISLAYELQRSGVVPVVGAETAGWSRDRTTLVVHDSYGIKVPWRDELFDVCIVPVTPSVIHVQVGPGRPAGGGMMEGRDSWTIHEGDAGFEQSLRTHYRPRRLPQGPHGFLYNVAFHPCPSMVGPAYTTPGGKRYEARASTAFVLSEEGRFVLPPPSR